MQQDVGGRRDVQQCEGMWKYEVAVRYGVTRQG